MALPDTDCAGLLLWMQLGDISRSAPPAPPVASSSSSGTAAILTALLFAGADVSLPARQLNPLPPSPPAQRAAINHLIVELGRPLHPQPGPEYFAEICQQHNMDDDDNYTAEAEEWDSDEDEPDNDHEDEQTNLPPPTHVKQEFMEIYIHQHDAAHSGSEEAEEDPEPDFEQGANRFLVPAHACGTVIELDSTPSPPPSPSPLHLSPCDVFRGYIHYPSIDLAYQHIKQEEIIFLHRVLIWDIPGIESTPERYVTNCNWTIRRTKELMELTSIHNQDLLHIDARLDWFRARLHDTLAAATNASSASGSGAPSASNASDS
ncbi:unnamed protein product [Cyclocybe aegerita]|uniref:Uncharacterized protein n=1 Tax=Cyclocybe aegerita TaxID=1973307 RepID=A0A8S0XKP9_CYCAE|nr:unnamed protein product [Cyclocybe aegerita]